MKDESCAFKLHCVETCVTHSLYHADVQQLCRCKSMLHTMQRLPMLTIIQMKPGLQIYTVLCNSQSKPCRCAVTVQMLLHALYYADATHAYYYPTGICSSKLHCAM